MRRALLGSIAVLIALLVEVPYAVPAEITARQAQRYCVDIVLLKGGVDLRGSVLSRDEKELRILVQRDWLATKHPEMARKLDEEVIANRAADYTELMDRITLWKQERAADARLVAVLQKELERLAQPALKELVPASQFRIVTVPMDRVRRGFTATDHARKLAMVAWDQQLPHVEDSMSDSLKTAVVEKVPNWETAPVDLADRMPQGESQTADEWAARQAIFEYEYRQQLDFQGTGNLVVRVGEGAEKPSIGELLARTTADTLQGELGGLGLEGLGLNPESDSKTKPLPEKRDWQKSAIAQAKSLDARGFRVTRIPQVTGSGPATVNNSFFARLSDGQYRIIWSNESTTDPATIQGDNLQQIEEDPQVQEVLKIANALSLGKDAKQAVRFGAAVQASMNDSENRFFEFRQRYHSTLDGPTLVLPSK